MKKRIIITAIVILIVAGLAYLVQRFRTGGEEKMSGRKRNGKRSAKK